jgi:NADH-quinone oxidoreductase subunit M
VIPFACVTFVIGGAASMGMPGFSGFIAEIQVLIGAFSMSPWLVVGAGVGILLTVAYILNAIHKVFFAEEEHVSGKAASSHGHGHEGAGDSRWNLPPISAPEIVAALILMALLVIVGLCPSIMLNMIKANVEIFLRGAP